MSKINHILKLHGPIAIFGAGGFVGVDLLTTILKSRNDVIGISSDPRKAWRLKANAISSKNIARCDLLNEKNIEEVIKKYRPKTIFNLAAYGAYSKQKDINKIYLTNFNSTLRLIEELKKYSFSAYVQSGSQSEYGLNSSAPGEDDELIPNSHYAVSKTAVYYLLKYYGKVEKLPVVHLRLYSVYGPWEEPDRLMSVLIRAAKKGKLPNFVDPQISRDFVYIDDVVEAMIMVADKIRRDQKKSDKSEKLYYGEAFNVCTGKKTTIKELAYLAKKLFKIKKEPKFETMRNRGWDLKDWYGNPEKIEKVFGWKAKTSLEKGLKKLNQSFKT